MGAYSYIYISLIKPYYYYSQVRNLREQAQEYLPQAVEERATVAEEAAEEGERRHGRYKAKGCSSLQVRERELLHPQHSLISP
jgi:F0F1-type ATP synthase membrane subunit b/b'